MMMMMVIKKSFINLDNVEFSKNELKNIEKKYKEDDELGEDEIKK